ncbi:MAG TPA: glycosyltransferase [Thiobacillus sp.]|nr:glycosyltransferase [Thiobacillus sp.]
MNTVGIVVHDGYKFIPNAYGTTRLGYLHGFQRIGLQAEFVEHGALSDFIAASPEPPLLWLTYGDYDHMDGDTLADVCACPHIVQVNTWFEGMEKLHAKFGAPSPHVPEHILNKIAASQPDFVWCSAPESYQSFYQGWRDAGHLVVSLPWAYDSPQYMPLEGAPIESGVAFVGGYRVYKEPQYDAYLWPYADRLKVWGYSKWPRCYQGVLPAEDEHRVYAGAIVCPTISEPQFAVTGDTVERPFKVLGSGGLTVFDPVPAYTHLFGSDEALIPENEPQYHDMMRWMLEDDDANAAYRQRGRDAVLARHTYAHRAAEILGGLER